MESETTRVLEGLVRAVVLDDGSWSYCPGCGMEMEVEPGDETGWCPTCSARVKLEGLNQL